MFGAMVTSVSEVTDATGVEMEAVGCVVACCAAGVATDSGAGGTSLRAAATLVGSSEKATVSFEGPGVDTKLVGGSGSVRGVLRAGASIAVIERWEVVRGGGTEAPAGGGTTACIEGCEAARGATKDAGFGGADDGSTGAVGVVIVAVVVMGAAPGGGLADGGGGANEFGGIEVDCGGIEVTLGRETVISGSAPRQSFHPRTMIGGRSGRDLNTWSKTAIEMNLPAGNGSSDARS
jgi:hypothetical protein